MTHKHDQNPLAKCPAKDDLIENLAKASKKFVAIIAAISALGAVLLYTANVISMPKELKATREQVRGLNEAMRITNAFDQRISSVEHNQNEFTAQLREQSKVITAIRESQIHSESDLQRLVKIEEERAARER